MIISIQSMLWQPDFRLRAEFLVSCIDEYKNSFGNYPEDIRELSCIPDDVTVLSVEMLDSNKLIGKGAFEFSQFVDGKILVIGNWYPPNLLYFFETQKYEQDSRYFLKTL